MDANTNPTVLLAEDEKLGLAVLLDRILESGHRNGPYLELLGCLLSIRFHQKRWNAFCDFEENYLSIGGDHCRSGWRRATRVYTTMKDRPTKPSYLGRLLAYPDKARRSVDNSPTLNQVEKISADFAKKPGLNNLSFVILRPADLHDQFRPGYVPCAISGDFKFRDGGLILNVMFRTNDALAVGYADIYYMRRLQLRVLAQAKKMNSRLRHANPGALNMFLCRSFIQVTGRNRKGDRIDGASSARALIQKLNCPT
jgi:thymidylate synthase